MWVGGLFFFFNLVCLGFFLRLAKLTLMAKLTFMAEKAPVTEVGQALPSPFLSYSL